MTSADSMTPADSDHGAESRLRELIARGFQFVHPCDANGEVVAVVGVRAHHNVVDVVQLYAEDNVVATRMPGDEQDILSPAKVLWRSEGAACRVLDDLLGLPDDRTPGSLTTATDTPASGCWVPVEPGRAKWLAATA
jgi:hypothetical protein